MCAVRPLGRSTHQKLNFEVVLAECPRTLNARFAHWSSNLSHHHLFITQLRWWLIKVHWRRVLLHVLSAEDLRIWICKSVSRNAKTYSPVMVDDSVNPNLSYHGWNPMPVRIDRIELKMDNISSLLWTKKKKKDTKDTISWQVSYDPMILIWSRDRFGFGFRVKERIEDLVFQLSSRLYPFFSHQAT